jgi:hypothetical protein
MGLQETKMNEIRVSNMNFFIEQREEKFLKQKTPLFWNGVFK